MKAFECERCKPFGGHRCVLSCDDDTVPTHCPATDSMKPYATWKELKKCICGHEAVDGNHCIDCAADKKNTIQFYDV